MIRDCNVLCGVLCGGYCYSQGKSMETGQTRRRNWFGLPVEAIERRREKRDNELDELEFMEKRGGRRQESVDQES